MAGVDVSAYLGFIFVTLFLFTVYLVYKYAEKGFPIQTYVTCIAGYFCTFAFMLIVPIDLAAVILDRRNNSDSTYNRDVNTMIDVYNSVFIPILILSNVVLVFEEYFNSDGYFTTVGKFISSFKRMMIDMFAGLVAGIIVLAILIGSKTTSGDAGALQLTAVIVTNTVYETMLMFLLGYGLVAFPRMMWNKADLDYSLLSAQMDASSEFKKLSEASLDVSLVVSDVMKTKKQLESYGDESLNAAMKILLGDCPEGFTSSTMGKVAVDKNGQVTVDTLANLRTRLKVNKDKYRMAQGRVETVKFDAYQLEDVCAARNRDDGQERIFWTLFNKESSTQEYLWHIKYRPLIYKCGALLTAMMAVFMILGVIGSINGAGNSSIYYHIVHNNSATATGIVIFVLFTLGYTAYITLWSLLQVKLAGLMELVEGSTTPESMSFNVRMCMRLTPPLAFFYLGWLRENGVEHEASFLNSADGLYSMPIAFTRIYAIGQISVLRKTFGTVFPILLFCLIFVFALNLWNRIAVKIKMPYLQFGAEIVTEDVLREGKRQLTRFRKHMERKCQRQAFRGKLDAAGKPIEGTEMGLFARMLFFFSPGSRGGGGGGGGSMMLDSEGGVDLESGESSTNGFNLGKEKVLRAPDPLSGMIERKAEKKMMGGGGWKPVFVCAVIPGQLHFYKDPQSMDNNIVNSDANAGADAELFPAFNLSLIMSVSAVDKSKKSSAYLDVDLGDQVVHLRFKSENEMEKWRVGLLAWKEYAIDHMSMYGVAATTMGGKRDKNADKLSLNAIQVDDDDDESAKSPHRGKKGAAYVSPVTNVDFDEKPAPLQGWLEKKSPKKLVGSEWQRRYFVVNERTNKLMYYKTDNTSEKETGSIDLLMVADICLYKDENGKNTDPSRFNIDMGDGHKDYKFKAANSIEAERWMAGLNAWREYCLMNMSNV